MDLGSLTIRRAERIDLPALVALYQQLNLGDEKPSTDRALAIFDSLQRIEGSAIFVGEMGSLMVGSCTLIVVPNLTRGGRPFGLIENVVAHVDHRNKRIGKRLLATASNAGWDAGCYKVMLMTGSTQSETLNFYRSAGFEQSKTGFQMRRRVR